jgi:hypothetical protein
MVLDGEDTMMGGWESIEAKSLLGIPSRSQNLKRQFKKHTDDSWQLDLDGSLCKSML